MQTMLQVTTKEQRHKIWAFAATRHRDRRLRRTRNQAVITAVSKEAKNLGIQAGMRYEEAKELFPELRVLIYGGHHAKRI